MMGMGCTDVVVVRRIAVAPLGLSILTDRQPWAYVDYATHRLTLAALMMSLA